MTFDDVRKPDWRGPRLRRNILRHAGAESAQEAVGAAEGDGDSLVMPGVPQDERDMLVESQPKLFYFTDHYRIFRWCWIRLSKAKPAIVEPLLRWHWRTLASKAAAREFDLPQKHDRGVRL